MRKYENDNKLAIINRYKMFRSYIQDKNRDWRCNSFGKVFTEQV